MQVYFVHIQDTRLLLHIHKITKIFKKASLLLLWPAALVLRTPNNSSYLCYQPCSLSSQCCRLTFCRIARGSCGVDDEVSRANLACFGSLCVCVPAAAWGGSAVGTFRLAGSALEEAALAGGCRGWLPNRELVARSRHCDTCMYTSNNEAGQPVNATFALSYHRCEC